MRILENLDFEFYPSFYDEPNEQLLEALTIRDNRAVSQQVKLKLIIEDPTIDVAFKVMTFNNIRNLDIIYDELTARDLTDKNICSIVPSKYTDRHRLPVAIEQQITVFFNDAAKILLRHGRVNAKCFSGRNLAFTLEAELTNVPTCPYVSPVLEFLTKNIITDDSSEPTSNIYINIELTETALNKGYLFTSRGAKSAQYTIDDHSDETQWESIANGFHKLIMEGRVDIVNSMEKEGLTVPIEEFYSQLLDALEEVKQVSRDAIYKTKLTVSTELFTIDII